MKLEQMLRSAWFTPGVNGRWGLPLLIWGKPGSAKTSRVVQASRAAGLAVETVIASLREPADFLGLPIPDGTGAVTYAPPAWARAMAKKGRGVVFMDELTTAPPAVQAALLRTIHEGHVGDLGLPPGIRFVAACNAVEDINGGYDLSPPLANRFVHLSNLDVNQKEWASWVLSGAGSQEITTGNPEAVEAEVMKQWPEAFARVAGTVTAFLSRKDCLLKMPKDQDPSASRAWPSPRSWELAIRAMAGAYCNGLSDVEADTFLAGCVGQGVAIEYATFRREVDLPDPVAVLEGKVKFKADNRLDRTQAVLSACTALVSPADAENRIPRAKALYKLMESMIKGNADLIVTSCDALLAAGLNSKLVGDEAKKCLTVALPALVAAGRLTLPTESQAK